MTSLTVRMLIAALIASLMGCDTLAPRSEEPARLSVHVMSAPAFVRNVVVYVSGPGIEDTIPRSITVVNGAARDTLLVPPGPRRYVLVIAFDSSGAPTHRGDTTVNLSAGANPPLELVLRPLTAIIPVIISFGDSVATMAVRPSAVTLTGPGAATSFTALALTVRGDTVPGIHFVWRSLNTEVATIDSATGLAIAIDDGQSMIEARVGTVTARASLTVGAGLIAYYRLDDLTDSLLFDSMGMHHGTNHGAGIGAPGRVGTCYTYDGATSYSDLNFGTGNYSSFSVQAWVKTTDTDGGGVVTSRNGPDGNLVGLRVSDAGLPAFNAARLDEEVTGDAAINDGQWHHIVGVFDGSTSMKHLYVDGVVTSASTSLTAVAPGANFYLGWDSHLATESNRWLAGNIDEVRIWSRALSPAEVVRLYTRP